MLEVVLVIAIASIGILTVAIGLLTSVSADNRANDQQRLNLAMTTFAESVRWVSPEECPGDQAFLNEDPPHPTNETVGAAPDSLRAAFLLAALEEPEMQAWVDRGITFSVTGVRYWDPEWEAELVGDPDHPALDHPCHDEDLRWPVVKVSLVACWGDDDDGGAGECRDDRTPIDAQVVKRGPSGNAVTGD